MKKVVIFPGRFQPMLPHHAEVYKKLQAQFPGADVYVATSDKVELPKSPFNFKEKVAIMTQLHDIPANRIIQAKSPYLVDSYTKSFDQENTMVIFAVGGKDEDRFPMNNVDPNTGLDMTVRGEPRPKFYQMINTLEQHPALPMSERGYIYHAPIVDKDGEVASASAFRNAFANAVDVEQQKEVFTKYMGNFDNGVFELLKNKMDNTMKEELNKLKFLAGLLSEAPISWDSEPEDDEEDFKPGFTQDNMVNQLGKIADSDEASKDAEAMKVKKFKVADTVITDDGKKFKLSGSEARALIKMFNMLSSQRAGEEESPREKFNRSIQQSKGLQSMLDFAKAKGLVEETVDLSQLLKLAGLNEGEGELPSKPEVMKYCKDGMSVAEICKKYPDCDQDKLRAMCKWANDALKQKQRVELGEDLGYMAPEEKAEGLVEETSAMPQLDLSDIRGEYGVEEGSGEEHFCQACNGSGCEKCDDTGIAKEYQDESFNDNNVEEGFDPEEFEGEFDWEGTGDDGETSPCTVSYVAKVNEMGRPVVDPKSIRIDCQQDGNSKLGFDPDFDLQMQDMNELLQACQEDADEMWDSRDNKYAHGESIEEAMCGCCGNDPCDCAPDCEGCKGMDESVHILDKALEDLKKLAGI